MNKGGVGSAPGDSCSSCSTERISELAGVSHGGFLLLPALQEGFEHWSLLWVLRGFSKDCGG